MRVAHLIQYFEIGGIERMVLALARSGRALGWRTSVAAWLGDGPIREALRDAGADTVLLPGAAGLRPDLPFRIARWLRRVEADVLHTHHLGPFLYGGAAARLVRVPHVHTEHSVELYDAPRRARLGWTMDHLAEVVSVSPAIAAFRQERFGHAGLVVLNGVEVPPPRGPREVAEARAAHGLPAGALVVGSVGRLAPEKDQVTLVEAFRRLHAERPDALLVIAGEGRSRPELEAAAAGLPVHLLGAVEAVDRLYPAFDVFCLSSVREGLPMALLEAQAHGIPAACTAVGGVPGLLRRGGGLTVPSGDPSALAGALAVYAGDPERRAADGARGREVVHERYGLERMAAAYDTIYRRAVGR